MNALGRLMACEPIPRKELAADAVVADVAALTCHAHSSTMSPNLARSVPDYNRIAVEALLEKMDLQSETIDLIKGALDVDDVLQRPHRYQPEDAHTHVEHFLQGLDAHTDHVIGEARGQGMDL